MTSDKTLMETEAITLSHYAWQKYTFRAVGITVSILMVKHRQFPLGAAILKNKIINPNALADFLERNEKVPIDGAFSMTKEEVLLLFTVFDIACKSQLSDMGDFIRDIVKAKTDQSDEDISATRSKLLETSEAYITMINDTYGDDLELKALKNKLDKIKI